MLSAPITAPGHGADDDDDDDDGIKKERLIENERKKNRKNSKKQKKEKKNELEDPSQRLRHWYVTETYRGSWSDAQL